ncbi:hypothetical protein BAE44_0011654 [Dichanthelium oligosanthes]|uniref:Uncharacterized protein n=1 Tax=Dichanthelium oligosanthes TaxID=888268 RepID=A0A1E5VQG7_9POAL|nr:hypothetical protein BAE44_0011654 [Dichanthelium oligosanthes]
MESIKNVRCMILIATAYLRCRRIGRSVTVTFLVSCRINVFT